MTDILVLLVTGLAAGILGGLLGIGGSVIMIPALTLLLGREQHLAQAAAMIVNVFVSAPAVWRHHRARAVAWPIVWRMVPVGLVTIIIGVFISDALPERTLRLAFGLFLLWFALTTVVRMLAARNKPSETTAAPASTPSAARLSIAAGVMGLFAGLLGIGGGIVAVPLLQRFAHLPLRAAIAASAAAMCVTAPIGAARKNMTLAEHGLSVTDSLEIAACLAPTAIVGGLIGAALTHRLPVHITRTALVVLLFVASVRYLAAS